MWTQFVSILLFSVKLVHGSSQMKWTNLWSREGWRTWRTVPAFDLFPGLTRRTTLTFSPSQGERIYTFRNKTCWVGPFVPRMLRYCTNLYISSWYNSIHFILVGNGLRCTEACKCAVWNPQVDQLRTLVLIISVQLVSVYKVTSCCTFANPTIVFHRKGTGAVCVLLYRCWSYLGQRGGRQTISLLLLWDSPFC